MKKNKNCGIYFIRNKINNKIYVGSSKNLYNREKEHFSDLRKGKHHNIYLQRAYDKYGEKYYGEMKDGIKAIGIYLKEKERIFLKK